MTKRAASALWVPRHCGLAVQPTLALPAGYKARPQTADHGLPSGQFPQVSAEIAPHWPNKQEQVRS